MENPERFWNKVKQSTPNNCWLWVASKTGGYGRFRIDGKVRKAHRVSWEIHNGSIPNGLCVLHNCDNPPCVNPGHLWLGTQEENILDMKRKGRGRGPTGKNQWTNLFPEKLAKGYKHRYSVLTESDVLAIRSADRYRGYQRDLARKYRVPQGNISKIVNYKSWKHL